MKMYKTFYYHADGRAFAVDTDVGTSAFEVGELLEPMVLLYAWKESDRAFWSPTYPTLEDAVHAAVQHLKAQKQE